MRKRPQMVLISWVDSAAQHGWRASDDSFPEVVQCESIGYLVASDKTKFCLAQSRAVSEDARPNADLITIPAVAVISMKMLRVGQ